MNARQRRHERRKGQYSHNVGVVFRSAWLAFNIRQVGGRPYAWGHE
jgi:hypothetical protein